jgi:membrane-bound lytic murein transglycosylase D
MRLLLLLAILFNLLSAKSLPQSVDLKKRFPSYGYVLGQFDISPSYIDDPTFRDFVIKNEAKYRRFYLNSLKRGKDFIPLFKNMLLSQGLSHLFIYMSMTESGFKRTIVSKKRAVGLWQFMAATARRFNLMVNHKRDDRLDPVASTKAAMRYIQSLYRMFGKWYLVIMSYNCGEGRVKRAIRRAGSDRFEILMSEKKRFIPKETRNYLKKIILLSMMGEKIKQSPLPKFKRIKKVLLPDSEISVNIYGGITLKRLSAILKMPISKILKLNPHLKGAVIGESIGLTQVTIPVKNFRFYKENYKPPTLQQIYAQKNYSKLISHIVKKGDTLGKISKKYQTTPLDLILVNKLEGSRLRPNTILMVPVSEELYDKLYQY